VPPWTPPPPPPPPPTVSIELLLLFQFDGGTHDVPLVRKIVTCAA
jgi:hypothetical protein